MKAVEQNGQMNRDRSREVEQFQQRIVQEAQALEQRQSEARRRNLQIEIGSRVGTIVNTSA